MIDLDIKKNFKQYVSEKSVKMFFFKQETEEESKQKSPDKLKADDTPTKTDIEKIGETLKEERKEPEEFQEETKDAWNVNEVEFVKISDANL